MLREREQEPPAHLKKLALSNLLQQNASRLTVQIVPSNWVANLVNLTAKFENFGTFCTWWKPEIKIWQLSKCWQLFDTFRKFSSAQSN